MNDPILVKIDAIHAGTLARLTPNSSGRWGACQFVADPKLKSCDYWVVLNYLTSAETARCPKENTIFVALEPPSVHLFNDGYAQQFGAVITCQDQLKHPNLVLQNQGYIWFTELSYDAHVAMGPIVKERLISVISSNKTMTPGHRERLHFLDRLRAHFGSRLDVYGRGIREMDSKWTALAPYRYHITLENSSYPHYWSEKLSDAYLAMCYPIYYGCPNIHDYFHPDMLTIIDIHQPDQAIDIIENCIDNKAYETSLEQIQTARRKVLDEYSLFAMLAQYIERVEKDRSRTMSKVNREKITLYPDSLFHSARPQRIKFKLKWFLQRHPLTKHTLAILLRMKRSLFSRINL